MTGGALLQAAQALQLAIDVPAAALIPSSLQLCCQVGVPV